MSDCADYRRVRRYAEFVDEREVDRQVAMSDRRESDAGGLLHSSFHRCPLI
jgi:hypothetical protein